MTTAIEDAAPGCTEPVLGTRVRRMLGQPLSLRLREHMTQCLACQVERLAFERFARLDAGLGSTKQ
jgi:hypothetical protein